MKNMGNVVTGDLQRVRGALITSLLVILILHFPHFLGKVVKIINQGDALFCLPLMLKLRVIISVEEKDG